MNVKIYQFLTWYTYCSHQWLILSNVLNKGIRILFAIFYKLSEIKRITIEVET
jgi:hypothetical protein